MSKLRDGPGKVPLVYFTAPLTLLNASSCQNAIQQRALRTLKQKRMYESQLAQLTQQTFNMESAALATENLRNTMATVDAMKMANKEMRKQYGKIDVDTIEVRACRVRSLRGAEGERDPGNSREVICRPR
jgi:Snf7